MDDLAAMRRSYALSSLDEADLAADPHTQFRRWFDEARRAQVDEPNAMVLATVDADGVPSARTVLLKELDTGFVFFTNHDSRKGQAIAAHPHAALVFLWKPLERQVCVAGRVEQVSRAESEAYFAQRPRESQLGAWASHQSHPVADRATLEAHYEAVRARHDGATVPCPPHWGGFRVLPDRVEFWQGRVGRLHDRLHYRRDADRWVVERLDP